MDQRLHRDLRQIRLVDADQSLARYLFIREDEPLTPEQEAAYREGWILREADAEGRIVRAYQLGRPAAR